MLLWGVGHVWEAKINQTSHSAWHCCLESQFQSKGCSFSSSHEPYTCNLSLLESKRWGLWSLKAFPLGSSIDGAQDWCSSCAMLISALLILYRCCAKVTQMHESIKAEADRAGLMTVLWRLDTSEYRHARQSYHFMMKRVNCKIDKPDLGLHL